MADNKLATTPTNQEVAIDRTSAYLSPAPSFMTGREGLEDITKKDILIPRLALAQALSPEVTDGDPKRIPNLKVGELFNSVTGQVYGKEVFVQIIRKDKPRAMEFIDIEDGGGVRDPDVPLDDPRMQWGPDGEKPVATLFLDYIARLLSNGGEIIALSFKSSGIKVAKALNGLIVMRNKPIYAGRYRITTAVELKPKPHQVYLVSNAEWVTEEDYKVGAVMYEAAKNLDTSEAIDRAPSGVDDFDPATLEAQSQAAQTAASEM